MQVRRVCWSEPSLRFGLYGSKLAWGARTTRGNIMDRRSFLIGLLGGLAAAPAMIAVSSASPASAASLDQMAPEPASRSGEAEVDLEKVEFDWSQWRYRHRRRVYRRVYRRAYRRGYYGGGGGYYPGTYRRRARRVYRRVYRRAYRRRFY